MSPRRLAPGTGGVGVTYNRGVYGAGIPPPIATPPDKKDCRTQVGVLQCSAVPYSIRGGEWGGGGDVALLLVPAGQKKRAMNKNGLINFNSSRALYSIMSRNKKKKTTQNKRKKKKMHRKAAGFHTFEEASSWRSFAARSSAVASASFAASVEALVLASDTWGKTRKKKYKQEKKQKHKPTKTFQLATSSMDGGRNTRYFFIKIKK